MNLKKVLSMALIVALLGVAAVGCGNNSNDNEGNAAQEITMNFRAEPPALDVSIAESSASFTFLGAINEGLYRTGKNMEVEPALAKDMPEISADGLTYTIKLRDNIKWADGSPVTADDFVYSFKRTLDPATKASYSFMVAWIKGGEAVMTASDAAAVAKAQEALGVVAKDEKTLVITLERPIAYFTSQLAFATFFPQKEAFVAPLADKNGADVDKVLGAGPFKLTKWDHGQMLVLEKNDQYWDAENVALKKVTINIVKDTNTGLNLYETNTADYTDIKGDQMKQYEGKPDLVVKNELTVGYLTFQENVPALKNEKIRKALAMAIDRKGHTDTVLVNGSVPSAGFVPNGNLDGNGKEFREVLKDTQPAFDVAKAKSLLAEGLKEANLTALPKLTIIGDDTETGKKSLEFLVSQWKTNLGIEVLAEPMPHKNRLDRELKKDYDIVSTLWGADYNDPMTWLDLWVTDGPFNTGSYSNSEYDALINAAITETDTTVRAQQLVDAEKILMADMPIAPLYYRSSVYLVRPSIQDMVLPPYGPDFELKFASVK
jgi:oligopeptide transport system substrate-binding protein